MGLNRVPRVLVQTEGEFNATHLQGKTPVDFLPTTHGCAAFGYNSVDGRIKHNGNDVTVLSSVNSTNATTSTKWAGYQIRVGSYSSGASGYITFSKS